MQSPASRSRCFAPRLPLPPPRITRSRNQHPGRIRTVLPSYVLLASALRGVIQFEMGGHGSSLTGVTEQGWLPPAG